MKIKIYLLILSSFLWGCGNSEQNNTSEDGYFAVVNHAAGDDYIVEDHTYMAYPFHDATFRNVTNENIRCAILSNKLSVGKKIRVMPMAMLTYEENTQLKYCIVGIPTDPSLMNLDINNFSDFMLKYAPVRNIIELWQLNKCGDGCAKMIAWKDEHATSLLLEQNLQR